MGMVPRGSQLDENEKNDVDVVVLYYTRIQAHQHSVGSRQVQLGRQHVNYCHFSRVLEYTAFPLALAGDCYR